MSTQSSVLIRANYIWAKSYGRPHWDSPIQNSIKAINHRILKSQLEILSLFFYVDLGQRIIRCQFKQENSKTLIEEIAYVICAITNKLAACKYHNIFNVICRSMFQ